MADEQEDNEQEDLGEEHVIVGENEKKVAESSVDPVDVEKDGIAKSVNLDDGVNPLDRQDSGLSVVSAVSEVSNFSEMDLDEFYIDENPPEELEEEEVETEEEVMVKFFGEINLIEVDVDLIEDVDYESLKDTFYDSIPMPLPYITESDMEDKEQEAYEQTQMVNKK